MNATPRVTGRVIFCDDIREEIGNRFTIVGAVLGGLHYPEFPAILPKLGLFILAQQPLDGATPFDLCFSYAEYEGEVVDLGRQEIGTEIPPMPSKIPPPTDGVKKILLQANFVYSPFVANKPGRLIVRAVQEGLETVLGELDIAPSDPDYAVQAASYPFALRLPDQNGAPSPS